MRVGNKWERMRDTDAIWNAYIRTPLRGNSVFIARLVYALLSELFVTVAIWSPAFQQLHCETRNRFAELHRDGIISATGCKFTIGRLSSRYPFVFDTLISIKFLMLRHTRCLAQRWNAYHARYVIAHDCSGNAYEKRFLPSIRATSESQKRNIQWERIHDDETIAQRYQIACLSALWLK